jgi:hypothetical protein
LIGREFATGGGGFRERDSSALIRRKRDRWDFVICPGKPKNSAGDIVLSLRRELTCRFKRKIEEFCHAFIVARRISKAK